jgi:quinol monooxygenase YgiN
VGRHADKQSTTGFHGTTNFSNVMGKRKTLRMTYAHYGSFVTQPGRRDEVVALLTRPGDLKDELGCLLYEVGVDSEHPDVVFVIELWRSAADHQASLQLDSVKAAIAEAMPMFTGEMTGQGFDVMGSPLRSDTD